MSDMSDTRNDDTPPWHPDNAPPGETDPEVWSRRCQSWCTSLPAAPSHSSDYTLRTHLKCPRCGFGFIYRTSNFSLRSSSDVTNYGICANPSCAHRWIEED
jgi:hypothetical protein